MNGGGKNMADCFYSSQVHIRIQNHMISGQLTSST